jgi:uncharacterized protein (TIGR03435 family)
VFRTGFLALSAVLALVGALFAQAPMSFEVAVVKPGEPSDSSAFIQLQQGGRVIVRNIPLERLITWAYQLRQNDERLLGVPEWIRREKFSVEAKAPEGVVALGSISAVGAPGPGLLMLRTLLAERFQLAMHTETRELPVYHLVTANADGRLGPKLTRADIECPALGAPLPSPAGGPPRCTYLLGMNRVVFRNQPMVQLADYLSGRMRRLVVDRTGLTGLFDFELTWTPDQPPSAGIPDRITVGGTQIDLTGGAPYDPNGPAFLTALREQLGFRLESTRGPVEVYVIDRIERPTPD